MPPPRPPVDIRARKAASGNVSRLVREFCASADRRTVRKLEEAFFQALRNYAACALCGRGRLARGYLVEARRWVDRCRELAGGEA